VEERAPGPALQKRAYVVVTSCITSSLWNSSAFRMSHGHDFPVSSETFRLGTGERNHFLNEKHSVGQLKQYSAGSIRNEFKSPMETYTSSWRSGRLRPGKPCPAIPVHTVLYWGSTPSASIRCLLTKILACKSDKYVSGLHFGWVSSFHEEVQGAKVRLGTNAKAHL
jgi:hypothetical protein